MNNFSSVFKVLFTRTYSKNKNNSTGKNISFMVIILLLGLFFLFLSLIYNVSFYFLFKELEIGEYYPLLMTIVVLLITIITSIFRSQSVLFSTKDHNILTPMPISKRTILSAKLVLFYLEETMFSLIILLPTVVLYSLTAPSFLFFGTLLMLFVPFIAILFSSAIGFIISLLTNRFKAAKIISSMLYVAFFVGIMFISMSFSFSNGDADAENINAIKDTLSSLSNFFLFDWILKGFVQNNILYLFIVLALSIVSGGSLILLYAIFYDNFYNMLLTSSSRKKYNQKNIARTNPILATMKKDIKLMFSSPLLLVNTISGGILCIVMMFLFGTNAAGNIPQDFQDFLYLTPLIICFFGGMSSLTCFAISIENKSIWILKTFPIKMREYVTAKILTNHLFNGLLTLAGSIISIIVLKFNLIMSIFTIVLPQLYVFTFSMLGLIINLIFPKLNWDSINQIKNSASAMIYTFGMMGIGIILSLISALIIFFIGNIYVYMIAITILILLLAVAFALILKYQSRKLMNNIQC